jgi:hypothetical protein
VTAHPLFIERIVFHMMCGTHTITRFWFLARPLACACAYCQRYDLSCIGGCFHTRRPAERERRLADDGLHDPAQVGPTGLPQTGVCSLVRALPPPPPLVGGRLPRCLALISSLARRSAPR